MFEIIIFYFTSELHIKEKIIFDSYYFELNEKKSE